MSGTFLHLSSLGAVAQLQFLFLGHFLSFVCWLVHLHSHFLPTVPGSTCEWIKTTVWSTPEFRWAFTPIRRSKTLVRLNVSAQFTTHEHMDKCPTGLNWVNTAKKNVYYCKSTGNSEHVRIKKRHWWFIKLSKKLHFFFWAVLIHPQRAQCRRFYWLRWRKLTNYVNSKATESIWHSWRQKPGEIDGVEQKWKRSFNTRGSW